MSGKNRAQKKKIEKKRQDQAARDWETLQKRMIIAALVMVGVSLIMIAVFLGEALSAAHLDYKLPFIGYGGTFLHPYVKLLGANVSLYWTMHVVGIGGMIVLCVLRAKHYEIPLYQAVITAILLAVLGYIGAKILYILENVDKVVQNGLELSGVSFFGTVFFMPLVLPLLARIYGKRGWAFLDYCTPAGLLMLVCIRIGCFLNGCCGGNTHWVEGRPVILPSQLIEVALDWILLAGLFYAESRPNGRFYGQLYGIFMAGYGLLRFVVEFTRETPKDLLFLSHGQIFSILAILVGGGMIFFWQRRMKLQEALE